MLVNAFTKITEMSLMTSVAVIIVLLLRIWLKRAPKVFSYALWGIVLFRLLCPVAVQSDFSFFGMVDVPYRASSILTAPAEYLPSNTPQEQYPALVPANNITAEIGKTPLPQSEEAANADKKAALLNIAAYIWLGGVLIMAAYAAFAYRRLRRRLITASLLKDNIYLADEIISPFVLGLGRPKIYLPSSLGEQEQAYIIMHEKYHIKRRDHLWKALAFAALCLHWFNPLGWVAFIQAGKDMEMSCDEAVIKQMGTGIMADYAASLLSLATGRKIVAGMPLAFGEGDTKERIRNLAKWRRPTFWVIAAAVIIGLIVAAGLLTDPADKREFALASTGIYDLEDELILEKIAQAEHLGDSSLINVNADNFDILLNADFSWANDGAIRFFYEKEQEIYSAQLRMFTEEKKYFITKTAPWPEQLARFKLSDYLSALKYLPQEEIRAFSPQADAYDILLETEGAPADYQRVITYDQTGAKAIDGWFIHLRIEPLHGENGIYNGYGDEVIHVFYGRASDPLDKAVHSAVMSYNEGKYFPGDIKHESHLVLAQETNTLEDNGQTERLSVYALVYYQEYKIIQSGLQAVSGSCVPAALSFVLGDDGEYILEEYWEPRDGTYYAQDVREKFPEQAAKEILESTEDYSARLKAECYQKALAELKMAGSIALQNK